MKNTCCVLNCSNGMGEKSTALKKSNVDKISFHFFPSDKKLCQVWLRKIGIEQEYDENGIKRKVCSKHFVQSDFRKNHVGTVNGKHPEKKLTAIAIPSLLLDAPPHGPEVIEEIQLDPTDYALRLHDEHSYSIQSIAGAIIHNIDVTNPSTHQESPFNKHTVCEQQTVGKTPQSKQTSIGSNIDYIHKSAEINVVARPSQLFDLLDRKNYPADISDDTDEDEAILDAPSSVSVEKLDFGLQSDGFCKIEDGRIDKCLDVILESSAADNNKKTLYELLPNDTLRVPEGWEERNRNKQTEFGPTYIIVLYEITLVENSVPIVFKSVTIDFLESKITAYLLSHLICYGGAQKFTNFLELNAFVEKFDAAITCDGVRDEMFHNVPHIPSGSFSDLVWRSNNCKFVVEDDNELCEGCALLKKALSNRLLRPTKENPEDKAKYINYKHLSRPQLEERLRQVTQQLKIQEKTVKRRKNKNKADVDAQ